MADKLGSMVELGWAASRGDSSDPDEFDTTFRQCDPSALKGNPSDEPTVGQSSPASAARTSRNSYSQEKVPFEPTLEDSDLNTDPSQFVDKEHQDDSRLPKPTIYRGSSGYHSPSISKHSERPLDPIIGSGQSGESQFDSQILFSSDYMDDKSHDPGKQEVRDKAGISPQETVNEDYLDEGDIHFSPVRSNTANSHISISKMQMSPKSISRKSSILSDLLTGKRLKMITMNQKRDLQGLIPRCSTPVPKDRTHSSEKHGDDQPQRCASLKELHEPKESRTYLAEGTSDLSTINATGSVSEGNTKQFSGQRSKSKITLSPEEVANMNETSGHTAEEPRTLSRGSNTISPERRTLASQERGPSAVEFSSYCSPQALQSLPVTLGRDKCRLSVRADGTSLHGKGIKEVKVIVAFDGLDDMIIEVKLLKRLQHEE